MRRSSAQAHIAGRDDGLVKVEPLLSSTGDWAEFLGQAARREDSDLIRKNQTTGRPLGSDAFVDELERTLGRVLRPRKPGPKATREEQRELARGIAYRVREIR